MTDQSALSAMKCIVTGKVQGVWFRASAKKEADKLGLCGYANNLPDGSVEVLACGEPQALEALFSWLHTGPELAKVTHITREDLAWQARHDFTVG